MCKILYYFYIICEYIHLFIYVRPTDRNNVVLLLCFVFIFNIHPIEKERVLLSRIY